MRLPTGYADTFAVLMENKVLGKGLFKKMEKMARFRNVVVHQYESTDPTIVVSILRNDLPDFERYKKAVIKFLGR
jgi:uncharacterized protein YutE (UPF0331/DUF86 family)